MLRRLLALALVCPWFCLSTSVLQAELVHYYSFDNQSARDSVGSNNGTINGNPGFVDGESGEDGDLAIRLNEEGAGFNDDHVILGDTEFGDTFSIAAWIRPLGDEQSNQMMAIAANTHGGFAGPDGFKWAINQWNDLDFSLRLETGDTDTGSNDGQVGVVELEPEWQHVAISFDKEVLQYEMFYNGESVRTGGILDFGDGYPWQIGAYLPNGEAPANAGFIGDIDSVAVFDHVLTVDEVTDIWQFGIDVPDLSLPGDFDDDGELTANDIDLLSEAVRTQDPDTRFDVNSDGNLDNLDRVFWIADLKRTWIGDSNLDSEFNSSDFVLVFSAGEYEDGIANNSTWATGDWNGDQEFSSGDFVVAFSDGGFELGPRPAANVPEPSTAVWLAGILLSCLRFRFGRTMAAE